MYRKTKHIHFVGIGGIGMSGIAELLLSLGYRVSGSDLRSTDITKRLEQLGGVIYQGHEAAWAAGADVVVTSTAIPAGNPEVLAAKEAHIPVIQRAEMLAELMRLKKYGIAVAGSHGKTSTTSMVAAVLAEAELDPTVVVGGKVHGLGSNAKLGEGEFLVAEADESDGSFLKLSPVIEVVTNIDLEHLDYYRDIEHIKDIFLEFIDRLPFYGVAVVCIDNDHVAEILPHIQKRIFTYGLSEQADLQAIKITSGNGTSSFTVRSHEGELGVIQPEPAGKTPDLQQPGSGQRRFGIGNRFPGDCPRTREIPGGAAAPAGQGRGWRCAGGGRLRAPSHRDQGHPGRCPRGLAGAAGGGGFSATSLQPDPGAVC